MEAPPLVATQICAAICAVMPLMTMVLWRKCWEGFDNCCSEAFGRTPLNEVSPKKTIGGSRCLQMKMPTAMLGEVFEFELDNGPPVRIALWSPWGCNRHGQCVTPLRRRSYFSAAFSRFQRCRPCRSTFSSPAGEQQWPLDRK